MADGYPEFFLRLPHGGPLARGRQTDEQGTNGSMRFVVPAGQPVRSEVSPNFAVRATSAHRLREQLTARGVIRPSQRWPGCLETTEEITFNSPSEAVSVLAGGNKNG